MTHTAEKDAGGKPCPYHSTLANGMRLFGPRHPCFTVYDDAPRECPCGCGEHGGPGCPCVECQS